MADPNQKAAGPAAEEQSRGLSTGQKAAIGAAAVLGIAAVAAGGYYLYDSHESKKQNKSPLKLHCQALAGHDLEGGDPYLEVTIGRVTAATAHKSNNKNPKWAEELICGMDLEHYNENVKICVVDKDLGRPDDKMGTCWIPFSQIPANTPAFFECGIGKRGSVSFTLCVKGTGAVNGSRVIRQADVHDAITLTAGYIKEDQAKSQAKPQKKEEQEKEEERPARRRKQRRNNDDKDDGEDEKKRRVERRRNRSKQNAGQVSGLEDLKDGVILQFESESSKKHLRIKKNGDTDCSGGHGVWAQFEVSREKGDKMFRLVNVGDDRNWLGVDKDGVYAADEDDATVFQAIETPDGDSIALKCSETGLTIGAEKDGSLFVQKRETEKLGHRFSFKTHRK